MRTFRSRPSHGFTLIEITIVIAIIALLAAILLPSLTRARAQGRLSGCKSNLRNLASAVDLYALENGHPPSVLASVAPLYISAIPVCPSSEQDTYSPGYVSATAPNAYTIACQGDNHRSVDLATNEPRYVFGAGLEP